LVLRELFCGSRRFNDIHRGVPRMSPTLLAKRLRSLEIAGIVERRRIGRSAAEYLLTEAGLELAPVIEGLAVWGRTWLPANLSRLAPDPDLVMWDMHRRLDLARMPPSRTVMCFIFTDQPQAKRRRWLVSDRSGAELCISDPGYEVDLFVRTDSRTITLVWYGDIPLARAIRDGAILLDGPPRLCRMFPSWLLLNQLAEVPRRLPLNEPVG
jgi:DNA-binding HxlR family transcriptional regulator